MTGAALRGRPTLRRLAIAGVRSLGGMLVGVFWGLAGELVYGAAW